MKIQDQEETRRANQELSRWMAGRFARVADHHDPPNYSHAVDMGHAFAYFQAVHTLGAVDYEAMHESLLLACAGSKGGDPMAILKERRGQILDYLRAACTDWRSALLWKRSRIDLEHHGKIAREKGIEQAAIDRTVCRVDDAIEDILVDRGRLL